MLRVCCRFSDHAEGGGECLAPPHSATHPHTECDQPLPVQRGQFQRHGTAASPGPRQMAPTTTSADATIWVVYGRGGVSRDVGFPAVLQFCGAVSATRSRRLPGVTLALQSRRSAMLRPGPARDQAGAPRNQNFRGNRSYWWQWGTRFPAQLRTPQEAVHMQVLQPAVHQVVQLADPREHAHGRATVLV
jgi:hypothetical protein